MTVTLGRRWPGSDDGARGEGGALAGAALLWGGYIENLLFGFLSVGLQIVQKTPTERKPSFSTVSLVWVNVGVVWTIKIQNSPNCFNIKCLKHNE